MIRRNSKRKTGRAGRWHSLLPRLHYSKKGLTENCVRTKSSGATGPWNGRRNSNSVKIKQHTLERSNRNSTYKIMSSELTIIKLKGNFWLDDKAPWKLQGSQTLNHYEKSEQSTEYCYATSTHLRKDAGRSAGRSTYMIYLFLQDNHFWMPEIS